MKRTPLARRTPLPQGGPLARRTALTRTPWVHIPKPRRPSRPSVSAAERHARRIVRERSGGRCEGCRRAPAVEYSHRVGRAQSGAWCPSNALHLCGPDGCHLWATLNRVEARSVGWILRSTDNPLTFPALLPGRGLVLLTPDGAFIPFERGAA